ncbi:unnamed protein product [Trichobilharzia regenti]|nr:unnamed protein product [Trichobilharzia regenti]
MFFNKVVRLGCCVASVAVIGTKLTFTSFQKALPSVVNAHALSGEDPWDWNWDGRHVTHSTPSSSVDGDNARTKSKHTRHLLFIRHGQYHYAKDDADCHLTGLGRQQLDCTGLRLKELNLPYRKLYYSTMTRAIESAELVLNHLPDVPAEPLSSLREGAPYLLEPPLPHYNPTPKDLQEDGTRIEDAFKCHVHRADEEQETDTYEVFVCHANVIRYFVCRALQFPPEAWIRFSLDHGNGRVTLRWLGNSGHMPPEFITVQ